MNTTDAGIVGKRLATAAILMALFLGGAVLIGAVGVLFRSV